MENRSGYIACRSPANEGQHRVAVRFHPRAILRLEVEPHERLGVGHAHVEPPAFRVPAVDGDAVQLEEVRERGLDLRQHRSGVGVLGVNVTIDGNTLPTYWADGLLVATSSGSTAYSLSVGGPICMPDTKVLIIAPISPHNLNVRPLVVPDTARITISIQSRDDKAIMTMDNKTMEIDPSWTIEVAMAQFSLKRIRLSKSEFVKALTSRLFWGEDMRNNG